MGIVQNKVSRRIALGSIAGGLAGTAVVLRALKGKYNVAVPEGGYVSEWGKYVKMFDVPIKDIEGPATFTLNYRPEVGEKFRALWLYSPCDESFSRVQYPKYPPERIYYVTEARVAQVSPMVDDEPALLIHILEHFGRGHGGAYNRPGAKCIAALGKDSMHIEYFDAGQGSPKMIAPGKVDSACAKIARTLMFDYPTGVALTRQSKWTLSETSRWCVKLPCEIAGFAEVANSKTVKILTQGHLSNQECQQSASQWGGYEKMLAKFTGGSSDAEIDAGTKREVSRIKSEQETQTYHITTYVDLKTGLVAREEARTTIHQPKRSDTTRILMTQMLKG